MRELQVPVPRNGAVDFLVALRQHPADRADLVAGWEAVEMPTSVVVFDNGETRNIFVLATSSAPGVIVVRRSSHWYEMRGMSPGVATLTFDLCGAIATTQVPVR